MTIVLTLLVMIGLGIVTASIMSAFTSRQAARPWHRPSRLARIFMPRYGGISIYRSSVPREQKLMESLKREARVTRARSSHRPRPR